MLNSHTHVRLVTRLTNSQEKSFRMTSVCKYYHWDSLLRKEKGRAVVNHTWILLHDVFCIFFPLQKILVDGLKSLRLLMDYCDVFISCLDSHSDGTHSLQRIHLVNK